MPTNIGPSPRHNNNVGPTAFTLKRTGGELRFCYEAGPCGYGIQRHLTAAGHDCGLRRKLFRMAE
ncbi:hypothetical protein FE249_20415 (plasmid) [Acidiphilium multivorum]|nr:hypothetical protein FE249_20415 [Acidiphilium multivorum]